VILAANGEHIDNAEALRNFQGLQPANARVTLDVRRDGKPLQLATGLREAPKALQGAQLDERLSGASFAELPESLRRQGLAGVLVESVARDSRDCPDRIAQRRRGAQRQQRRVQRPHRLPCGDVRATPATGPARAAQRPRV
jgi:hypothetical protein